MTIAPLDAWAAVVTFSDERTFMDPHSIRPNASTVREFIARDFAARFDIPPAAAWKLAYRKGWRVIRVRIVPTAQEPTP